MNNNYTQEVKKALQIAEQVAIKTGGLIGTEHILFGLLSIEDSIASKVLRHYNISRELIAEYLTPSGSITMTLGESMYSPRAKNVKYIAVLIANELHQNFVGTEHFLLALIDNDECVATRILVENGVDIKEIKTNFIEEFKRNRNGMTSAVYEDKTDSRSPYQEDNFDSRTIKEEQLSKFMNSHFDENNFCYEEEDNELSKLGYDLTIKAKKGLLDPVIGRDDEIERIIQTLCRRTKNNPVLIGEPGVGKSAIADGLAQKIVEGDVPELLKNKRIFSLDLASIVAGTKYRGEFEERFKNALDMVKNDGNIILFIDEIHTIVNAGSTEGSLDAANILKPLMARGEIQTIGATTFDEYRKYIEKDPALERRFQPVMVEPPTVENSILILKGLRDKYEAHHKVRITDEAIKAAVDMSNRYITDRFLPDKAIDLIDEASSKKRLSNYITPEKIKSVEDNIKALNIELNEALANNNNQKAIDIGNQMTKLLNEQDELKNKWKDKRSMDKLAVDADDIAEVVADWTHIPVAKLTEDESKRLMNLENILRKRVIGQDEAVSSVARAIKRARAGLQDPNRPIGSFAFLGPTGVGKTELSKALAEAMFGDENLMIRVDMSEYMDKANVSKLIGSAPGYVGYDEGGQLTEKVRRNPYSVVLFDEIEKAHPDIFNILLQVLDDGRITDSHGRTVSFKNTIIIMTSNIGATEISNMKSLGFGGKTEIRDDYEMMKERQLNALKKAMKPEFVNRIDEIIIFRKLGVDELSHIADIMINSLQKRLLDKGITIEITDNAKQYIVSRGNDTEYGARPLRRTIQRLLEDRLSEEILLNHIELGSKVKVDKQNNDLVFIKN